MERSLMLTDKLKKNTQSLHDKVEQNHFMQKLQTKSFSKEDSSKNIISRLVFIFDK